MVLTIGIASALACDAFGAFAALAAQAVRVRERRGAGAAALFFVLMPVAGWSTGVRMRAAMYGHEHWMQFGLLLLAGVLLIGQARRRGSANPGPLWTAFGRVHATFARAFALGIVLAAAEVPVASHALAIGFAGGLAGQVGFYFAPARSEGRRAAGAAGALLVVLSALTVPFFFAAFWADARAMWEMVGSFLQALWDAIKTFF